VTTPAPAPRRSGGLPIHVLLVDDHPAVRHGVRQLLAAQTDLITIAEAGTASAATSDLARWVDVAVIDYHLGDRDGLWLTQQIKRRPSSPPVLVYSAFADAALAAAAIAAGADGVLSKAALNEELCMAIRRLFHGRQYLPTIPDSFIAALKSRLGPRDQAILSMLIEGARPTEISSRLGIAAAELEMRRWLIVQNISPHTTSIAAGYAPLDYERPRRRRRYPAAG
jgi:DNA-binding NarL/FixJ family response regulator